MSWKEIELEPYRVLAKEGLLDAVMIGHLYHPRFSDGQMLPASLSAKAIRALRNTSWIDFDGVVFSDDMEMGAVAHELFDRGSRDQGDQCRHRRDRVLQCRQSRPRSRGQDPRHHRRRGADGRISRLRIEQAYGKIRLLKRRLAQHELAGKW